MNRNRQVGTLLGHQWPRAVMMAAVLALGSASGRAFAEKSVLDRFVGRWDVRVQTLQPVKSDVAYAETYKWVLGRQFIQGETEGKADGSHDVVFGTFDAKARGYPFWIFSSTGSYTYLPPATWDARGQTMDWKNPPNSDIVYSGRCTFPDTRTRRCTVLVKDWKGTVLLEQHTTAVRRDR